MNRSIADFQLHSPSPVTPETDTNYLTSSLFTGHVPGIEEALSMIEGEQKMRDVTLDDLIATPLIEASECSLEGLRYIAGYIASWCASIDKSLGHASGKLIELPEGPTRSGWIEKLSRGGLIVPADEWFEVVQQLEVVCLNFHGSRLCKEANVMKNPMRLSIAKFPNISEEVIIMYAKTRFFHLHKASQQSSKSNEG